MGYPVMYTDRNDILKRIFAFAFALTLFFNLSSIAAIGAPPEAKWTNATKPVQNIGGKLTLTAQNLTPGGADFWCFKVNGSTAFASQLFSLSTTSFGGQEWPGGYSSWSNSSGCSLGQTRGGEDGKFVFSTDSWVSGVYWFELRVMSRTPFPNGEYSSWDSIEVHIENDNPQSQWSSESISGYGTITLTAEAKVSGRSSASLKDLCVWVRGSNVLDFSAEFSETADGLFTPLGFYQQFGSSSYCLSERLDKFSVFLKFRLNTSAWPNGDYQIGLSATDTLDKFSFGSDYLSLEVQRPRPFVSSQVYGQEESKFSSTIRYDFNQPQGSNDNPALSYSVRVDGVERCSGPLTQLSSQVICALEMSTLNNGKHTARLTMFLKDGQSYYPITDLGFESDLIQRPKPELNSLTYIERGYFSFASVAMSSPLGAHKIAAAYCQLDDFQEEEANIELDRISCQELGDGLGSRAHTLRVRLVLDNNSVVSKTFPFQSRIKNRPFPKISSIFSSQIGDWKQKLEFGVTSVLNGSSIERVDWYLNAKRLSGTFGLKNNKHYILFESKTVPNGRYLARAKISLADGQTKNIYLPISVELLPPPPPPPTIAWNSSITSKVWKSGESVSVSGRLSGSGQRAKSVSFRTWQMRAGWSSWRTASVSSSGVFSATVIATGNSTIELKVPQAGRTPSASGKTNFKVSGVLKVSAPKRLARGSSASYEVTVQPKWSGYVSCTYKVERFNQFGVLLEEPTYTYPNVKITNGIGKYSPGVAEYRYNQLTLACGVDWSGLEYTSSSSGSTKISIY
jgi:hypothetical protein